MDYRYCKLVCLVCGKLKSKCKCMSQKPSWKEESKSDLFTRHYDWCDSESVGIGNWCNDCANRFECFTTKE